MKLPGFLLENFWMEFTSFKGAADALADDLKRQYRERLPFAGVVALTRSAKDARDALKVDMKRVFKSPTPYALNAAKAKPATKQTMASAVLLREFGGTPAEYFLGPEIESGARRAKRFEKALRDAGILPAGRYAVPGKAATLDRYGNQTAAELVQILSALKAFSEVGYRANRTAKADARWLRQTHPKVRPKFFVARSNRGGRQPLGIFKVASRGKVVPVVIFVRSPHYSERFDFYGLARSHMEGAFPKRLDEALSIQD